MVITKHILTITSLFVLGLAYLNFQTTFTSQSVSNPFEAFNNIVSVQADTPDQYMALLLGAVYCEDPGQTPIMIPGANVQLTLKKTSSFPSNISGIPNQVTGNATTDSHGQFKIGDYTEIGQFGGLSQVASALSNGWITIGFNVTSLPGTLPAAINHPDFRQGKPNAVNCSNKINNLCNNNVCNADQSAYVDCNMNGKADSQMITHTNAVQFKYTNCTAAPPTTPPTAPPTVPPTTPPEPSTISCLQLGKTPADISYSRNTAKTIQFTCIAKEGSDLANKAAFRVLNDKNRNGEFTAPSEVITEARDKMLNANKEATWSYEVTPTSQVGPHLVQCQICKDSLCTTWGTAEAKPIN